MAFRRTSLLNLNLDILHHIIKMCDKFTLGSLAQTCRLFASIIQKTISFENASWYKIHFNYDHAPPVFNPRGGVLIGTKFYLPFMTAEPNCFELDISNWTWKRHRIKVQGKVKIKAFVTTAVTIGPLIYLFGGREVQSFTLANTLYVLDTRDFQLKLIDDARGTPPRPRHEHSVDVLYDRYVAIFGGLCYHSVGENDMFLYDTVENAWLEPHVVGRTPHIRFGHASVVIDNSIYIFGGCQIENECNRIYDDLYKFNFAKSTWYKYEHPEMFDVRRHASKKREEAEEMDVDPESPIFTSLSMDTDYLIPTTGHYPRDRFQCAMIAISNKLVIFGGHTVRQDDDDNNELFDYSISQIDIFDPEWCHWTSLESTSEAGPVYPADMSYGLFPSDISLTKGGYKVFAVGQHKIFDGHSSQLDPLSSTSTGSLTGRSEKSKVQGDSYFSVPVDPLSNMHASGALATPHALLNVDGQSEQLPILSEPSRWVKSPGNLRPEEEPDSGTHPALQDDTAIKRDNPPIDTSATNRNDAINPSRKLRSKDKAAADTEIRPPDDTPLTNDVKDMFRQEVDLVKEQQSPNDKTMRISTNLDSAPAAKPNSASSAASSLYPSRAFHSGRRDGEDHSSNSQRGSSGSGNSNLTGFAFGPTSNDSTTSEGWYGKDTRKYSLESFCMLLSLNSNVVMDR